MKIRRVKKNEAKEIAKLRRETFRNINGRDYSKKNILAFNKKNTSRKILEKIKKRKMFCLVDKNVILGVIDLEQNKIGGLFVKHNYLRKGIGTKLLEHVENYAKRRGVKKVKLYATKYGYPFYEKNNYKLIGKKFWIVDDLKIINYYMEKKW